MNTQLLKRMVLALVFGLAVSAPMWSIAATVTFTSSGTWTVPAGVTSVTVEAWGGGGAGGGQNQNSDGGGGGGGGAYVKSTGVAVTPGSNIAVTVGAGGVATSGGAGGAGGDSSFINSSTVMAKGGAGGAPSTGTPPAGGSGGSAVNSVGVTKFAGGNGGQGLDSNTGQGGPGGSSAGTAAAGTAGPTPWSTTTASAAPAGGGIGGNGGTQGNNGSAPASGNGGGGGGSGEGGSRSGGNGAAGKVIITYVAVPTVATNPATLVSALDATLNGTVTSDNASTTVVFEYGLTTAYGTTVTATQSPVAANATSVAVSAAITGLAAGTTYHYRVKGTNSTGTANGADATFTTMPALSKVASAASASVGDVVTFTITLANSTGAAFASKTVTDTLPAGMTYGSHVVSGGTVAVAGQVVTWTTPSIPANSSATLTLAVSLSQQGTLTNSVAASGFTTATASVLVLANAVTHFRMDEPVGSWTGAAGEVLDSGSTGLHGRRITTTSPTTTNEIAPTPTIASQFSSVVGGFCNAASFDGNAVVQVASSTQFSYTTTLSASAWIYPTSYNSSDLSSILSNDVNYEFHLDSNGKLYWWWNASSLTSATTIPLNQWTHVAITFDSTNGRQRIYINGVQDANTNNWQGTLQNNPCNFYIGGDVGTGSCAPIPSRNFHGNIDEVKLYSKELSAAEVQADMTLGRSCSGTYDHIQIEHDGAASICTPEAVTVKACLNANCSTLYTGAVTVQLSPAGWVGGNTFTFSGGIGSRQLSNGTPGNVTLGTVSASPIPTSATRCFNGASETCTMNFANASCTFDAVETGAAPQTRLFTKLASTAFSVDVLALSSATTINTGYTGAVDVDLVDTSSATCPSGAGLNTATSITFAGADSGRKPIAFTYNAAAPNVRVRMRVGASAPACSTDNFAIRPAGAQLNTTALATPPSRTASPSFKAGTVFGLSATTNVGTSYGGTWTLDTAKLTAQTTTQDTTQQTGGVVGTLTPSSLVANAGVANATYSEVGYVYLAPGAYIDSSFTAVDRANGDCITSTTGGANLSDVLSGGKYGCDIGNRSAVSLGRFYPDHFAIAAPVVTPFCAAGAPAVPFTYFGQDGFATAFTMTAQNSANVTTQNYRGAFAKFGPTTYANYGFSATALPALPGGSALQASATAPTGAWVDGVAAVTARHQISRPTNASADVLVTVNAAPTDGEASASATAVGSNVRLRYGRLRMQNAYGSELLALPMVLEAQYWNGTFYTTNTDDSCTALPMSSIVMSNFTGNLTACETHMAPTGTPALAGGKLAGFELTKPGTGNSGSVDLSVNVTGTASGNTCVTSTSSAATAANLPWFGPNVGGRATFGIYRSPLIYLRENY